MSVREIRKILKECIEGEDKKKPLTDDELADILKEKKGIPLPADSSQIPSTAEYPRSTTAEMRVFKY